jgi:hypothetical protein
LQQKTIKFGVCPLAMEPTRSGFGAKQYMALAADDYVQQINIVTD